MAEVSSPRNFDVAARGVASLSPPLDDSLVEAPLENSDNGAGSSNAAKKPAWNKPSNGTVEVGPVIDAVSWPALSESARASAKSSFSDTVKASSDGSSMVSQVTGIESYSSKEQVITNNTKPNLTTNHVTPTRQKSMKRSGGGSSGSIAANDGFLQQSPPQPALGPVLDMPANAAGKPGSAVLESNSRVHTQKESGPKGGFGSQPHTGNEHPQQRNTFRRGNGGPHARGDGSYHHNAGGRRDQEHGSRDWNSNRSFNGRDAHMQAQRISPRGFLRPHSSTPFIPPPPVPMRPFGNPMVYPEVASPMIYVPVQPPDSLRGVPMVASLPPHPMFFPGPDPQLYTKIVSQIDYYFSNENLIKDTFLRKNMDEQGWVPIDLIAGFKKVMILSDNIQLIADALHTSNVVELQGYKVRRRNDWRRWIMPRPIQFPSVSNPRSPGSSSHDVLATNIQSVSLEDNPSKQGEAEAILT